MLQRFVVTLIRVITHTFFRRVDVVGLERVPTEGPVVFAGNHPNALMDSWLLTAKCGRWPLHFMANAKLWEYPLLSSLLNASGAVPVRRREEHEGDVDNSGAFNRLFEVLEGGHCMGIFPEGVSHTESQLTKLKTGAARIALEVAARGKVGVKIVPCGLNYLHRHRFRSQVLLEFGEPIDIDRQWIERFELDQHAAAVELTTLLASMLGLVTLNAPDWKTLRIVQTARRLYKPLGSKLTPAQYVELNRRFVERYVEDVAEPELQVLSRDVEDYQARLDILGLKDHQLAKPVNARIAMQKVMFRSLRMLALLPLAIPGALLHLPVGWVAATVGDRFSYEMDDVATLKVLATVLLLPVLYLSVTVAIGVYFGWWWALAGLVGLSVSFLASVRLLEAEAGLLLSTVSILRLTRLSGEVEELRTIRRDLVARVRARVDAMVDPALPRIYDREDFE